MHVLYPVGELEALRGEEDLNLLSPQPALLQYLHPEMDFLRLTPLKSLAQVRREKGGMMTAVRGHMACTIWHTPSLDATLPTASKAVWSHTP